MCRNVLTSRARPYTSTRQSRGIHRCLAMKNGSDEATAGAGVFYQDGDVRNKSIRLPNEVGQRNQASEIIGAKTAAEDTPKRCGNGLNQRLKACPTGPGRMLHQVGGWRLLSNSEQHHHASNGRKISCTKHTNKVDLGQGPLREPWERRCQYARRNSKHERRTWPGWPDDSTRTPNLWSETWL